MVASAPGSFVYSANPARVIFGSGTLSGLRDEAERLGLQRVLVLSTTAQAAEALKLADQLGSLSAGVFSGAVMHTPVDVTEIAIKVVRDLRVDGFVAVGGGSTIGLGKALALRTDLPQIVIPTSYAGSEMTPILGETAGGRKTTQNTPKVLPEVVIYDVDLTMTLPKGLSGTSGINAIAHAVEALYARDRNPIIDLMALEAVGSLATALPRISIDLADREARTMALYGAWLCGACLGAVGHVNSPQALSYARRHLRPAPCRNPQHRAAACAGLQRASNTRRYGSPRTNPWCRQRRARPL